MTDKIVINQIIKCIPVLLAFGILCSCENDVKKVALKGTRMMDLVGKENMAKAKSFFQEKYKKQ